jgi:glycosyltransferase involved in cell wall biosynthesis
MSHEEPIRYSVVVPVYGNESSLPALVERLIALASSRKGRLEGVFVVDGSPDRSLAVLLDLLSSGTLTAQVLSLSRNFGSFSAIRAGMAAARGDFLAVMAADLQEPVEVVDAFFDKLECDECDVVFGRREGRSDPLMSSLTARTYWWLYRRFVNPEIPVGGIDVFGCTRAVAERVIQFPETHTSLVGLLFWVGYRREFVPYRRQPRHSGRSAWSTRRKLRYLLDSVYAFTDLPIVLLQIVGAIGLIVSLAVGVVVFVAWAMGAIRQPGYTPLMIAIVGSTSALLVALGVVGSYVWRTYENSKGRPLELVATHEVFDPVRESEAALLAADADDGGRR